jgi:Na+/H+ antiporter NhaD/arsenite permease-like protein
VVVVLLALFYALDTYFYSRDAGPPAIPDPTPETRRMTLRGKRNLILILMLVAVIAASGAWKPGISFNLRGTNLELQNLLRDAVILILAVISIAVTPKSNRIQNDFNWRPIAEVAKIFAGIFICIVPVSAALAAGRNGAFAPLLALVSNPDGSPNEVAYFWLTGLLSSVLDNAPTYLVFFDLAGGDPVRLMGPLALTLAAISTGAVFMGGEHLYRQRAELHGLRDRQGAGGPDAWFPRLHAVVGSDPAAHLRLGDADLLPDLTGVQRSVSLSSMRRLRA